MVLPAIVSQAIGNTFENTTQKIYPAMNRYAVQSFDNLSAVANEAQAYESIVLMPKTEISATKLALKIKGANNIGVKCEINGEAVQVSAANDGIAAYRFARVCEENRRVQRRQRKRFFE